MEELVEEIKHSLMVFLTKSLLKPVQKQEVYSQDGTQKKMKLEILIVLIVPYQIIG